MKITLDMDPVELDRLLCAVELELNGNGATAPRGHPFADSVARRLARGVRFENCASAAALLPVYRDLLCAWENLPNRPPREVAVVDFEADAKVLESLGYPHLASEVRASAHDRAKSSAASVSDNGASPTPAACRHCASEIGKRQRALMRVLLSRLTPLQAASALEEWESVIAVKGWGGKGSKR